jgi:hypothetical protein
MNDKTTQSYHAEPQSASFSHAFLLGLLLRCGA